MYNTQRILSDNYNMSYLIFLDNVKTLNSQLSMNMFSHLSLKQLIDLKVDYSLVCCELTEVRNNQERYLDKIVTFTVNTEPYFHKKLDLISNRLNELLK